ncbi:MAG: T9SS type A sorting domain-containing protein [Niastella sp.]|jgi:hypothetical protein|uniref:T9SS type A sorting domain-containing protein n=1 Tax=Niastella sp. TaxID=1869183 RepID=UPI00389AF475
MKTVFQKSPVKGFLFTIILPIAILWVNIPKVQPIGQEQSIVQDAGGQKIVSRIITLQTVLEEEVLNISPVHATSYSSITWSSTSNIKLDITLFDVGGHAVLSRQYPLKKGVNELLLTNLETLPAGVYFVKAFDGAHHGNGKLVINHIL